MRRFELKEGTSNKFWEVDVEGSGLTVRFGKIGTAGQTQTKSFPSEEKAKAERDKLIKEKTGKGYSEIKAAEGAKLEAVAPKEPPAEAKPKKTKEAPEPETEEGWLDAGNGYRLALREGKLVAKNPAGKQLASVPKEIKSSEAASQLEDVRDWIVAHDKQCLETVETWMLRSLPTPRAVLASVWADPSWRRALENAVVSAGDTAGFFRGVDDKRGIGIVNLDGETVWIDAPSITIPHPILLAELDDFRTLAAELSLTQGIAQLFRETFQKPKTISKEQTAISEFRGGKFAQLMHALGVCKKHGYRVSGGSAITRIWQNGKVFEARFYVGTEDPSVETYTEDLVFVDERERSILLADVDPVAFSEGMRMASTIYAARVIEKEAA
jgi:predicted DNA-binding WGR domain protein